MEQSIILDPLGDGKSQLQLVDRMGNDLTIVNCARVSFNSESQELTDKDEKLIKYLLEHKHMSPFRGVVFQFKVKAPLRICRQWWKHVVSSTHTEEQLQHNEQSFRYTTIDSNEFYIPKTFRRQSEDNKQASITDSEVENNQLCNRIFANACTDSFLAYEQLLKQGVCREQSSFVLNPAIYTSWVWTTSLQALLNFINLRDKTDAQGEIQVYANGLKELIQPYVPITMKYWNLKNE